MMGFTVTVIEILLAGLVLVGFIYEEKLCEFEEKLAKIIARAIINYRKKRRAQANVLSVDYRGRAGKHCA